MKEEGVLFNNLFRVKSVRYEGYDYSQSGSYFVTICAKGKDFYFGEITEAKMVLSELGKMAQECWLEIPKHFPFVELDEFIVMPNHIHGVIVINVETQNLASLRKNNPNQIQNLAFL